MLSQPLQTPAERVRGRGNEYKHRREPDFRVLPQGPDPTVHIPVADRLHVNIARFVGAITRWFGREWRRPNWDMSPGQSGFHGKDWVGSKTPWSKQHQERPRDSYYVRE
jgi:hypothetical protein